MNSIDELQGQHQTVQATLDPISELKNEHQAVKVTLAILGEIASRLSRREEVDLEHIEELVEFLTIFVDRCHHGKEEDLLFKALEKMGVPREGGPIGVMLSEHDLGRGYIRGLRQGLTALKAGDQNAVALVIENIEKYSDLLSAHIEKEDNILYPIAEKLFSAEEKKVLTQGFEEIEEHRVGAGKHEKFHRMIHRLQEIYLG